MTKEEILEKRRNIFGNAHMKLFSDTILKMMDEFAKQQAIAFGEWCAGNYIRDYEPIDASLPIPERKYRRYWTDNDQREYQTEELYAAFIEQQNKDNGNR